MTWIVEPVPDALLFDASEKLSRASLEALFAMGFRGGIRTVGLHGPAPEDIDARELGDFMTVGLGLMLYQHPLNPGWMPSAALGKSHGEVASGLSQAAGYLPGATLWNDLEGPSPMAGASQVVAYANTKFSTVVAKGYPQGEYIGFGLPLSGGDLFHRLKASIYWRSLSSVPDVAVRGYAMRQLVEASAGPALVDISIAEADRLGSRPMWMRNVG